MPLQTGTQAIFGAATGSVCIALTVPSLVIFAFSVAGWVLLVGVLTGYIGGVFLLGAWRARPSDVELDDAALRIVGGPKHGLVIAWETIRACTIEQKDEYGAGLIVNVGEGTQEKEVLLATTMDDDEEASLDAVRQTLLMLRDRSPLATAEPTTEALILACTNCGGLAAPAAEPHVTCTFCGTTIDMPAEIREKVSTSARLEKSRRVIARYASHFLQSTLARARWAMVPTGLALAVWLVAIVAGISMYEQGQSSAWGILFLTIALGFLAPGVTALFGGVLIGRQAAPILALNLGALPPAKAGEPHTCRSCGGPLVAPVKGVVTSCIFCGADNVLGFSLGREASRAALQAGLLEETVTATRRARARWQHGGLAAAGACLLASTIALMSIRTQVSAEGGARELRRITWNPFDDVREPLPSRDGTMVLYRIKDRIHDHVIFVDGVVAAPGGAGKDLGNRWDLSNAEWLAMFNLSDRDPEKPKPDDGGCGMQHATRTADGRRVAYIANCDGRGRLYVSEVASGVSRLLTSGVAPAARPHWGGAFLYFDAGGSIYRLRPPD